MHLTKDKKIEKENILKSITTKNQPKQPYLTMQYSHNVRYESNFFTLFIEDNQSQIQLSYYEKDIISSSYGYRKIITKEQLTKNGLSDITSFYSFVQVVLGDDYKDEIPKNFLYETIDSNFIYLTFIFNKIITKTIKFTLEFFENPLYCSKPKENTIAKQTNQLELLEKLTERLEKLTERLDNQEKQIKNLEINNTKLNDDNLALKNIINKHLTVFSGLHDGNKPIMIKHTIDKLNIHLYNGATYLDGFHQPNLYVKQESFNDDNLLAGYLKEISCDNIVVNFIASNEFDNVNCCNLALLPDSVKYLLIMGNYDVSILKGIYFLKNLHQIGFDNVTSIEKCIEILNRIVRLRNVTVRSSIDVKELILSFNLTFDFNEDDKQKIFDAFGKTLIFISFEKKQLTLLSKF